MTSPTRRRCHCQRLVAAPEAWLAIRNEEERTCCPASEERDGNARWKFIVSAAPDVPARCRVPSASPSSPLRSATWLPSEHISCALETTQSVSLLTFSIDLRRRLAQRCMSMETFGLGFIPRETVDNVTAVC